jgi:5-methyltetrahydropteroyltriglutamate--homocysteine methyltransferase
MHDEIARAETVGSLLRPDYVREMRQGIRDGTVTPEQRRAVEDRAVREAIELQERIGLDVITDGELRRTSWIATMPQTSDVTHKHLFDGFKILEGGGRGWIRFWFDNAGNAVVRPPRPRPIVVDNLSFANDITAEYQFLKANAHTRTKFCFPAPSYHRIFYHRELSKGAYATSRDFLFDVADKLRQHVVKRLLDMGCDYIQLDAPNYGQFYVDPKVVKAYEEEDGEDMAANLIEDAEVDNYLFEGISNVTKALHVCRGNGPGGYWSAYGGYEAMGPMFQRIPNIDTLLLEYDTPRAGDFNPLRHVLPMTNVVLGLLTTKEGALEEAADVEARIREATQYVPLERLALSPQCGFASAEGGNPITPAQQEAKLRLVRQVATKVWG